MMVDLTAALVVTSWEQQDQLRVRCDTIWEEQHPDAVEWCEGYLVARLADDSVIVYSNVRDDLLRSGTNKPFITEELIDEPLGQAWALVQVLLDHA